MKTELFVEGMTCNSCVRHVGAAIRKLAGIGTVDVQLREGKVIVDHDPSTEPDAIADAVVEAGYPANVRPG